MKSGFIRSALTAGVAVALLASATACGSGGGAASKEADGPVTLEFQTAQSADSTVLAALKDVTAKFQAANPGVTVDLKTGADDYEAQMKVRLAARNPPDLWATHGWSLQRYSKFLAPLQNEPWATNFNASLAPAMMGPDGDFYALPVDIAASGLIVNEDVLAHAGVDPTKLTTWDAFQHAADAVKSDGVVPLTLAGGKDGSAGNVIDWLAPGAFSDTELQGFKDGTFQSQPYQNLLGVLQKFKADGYTNKDYSSATGDDMARALAEGKAAFALSSNSLISQAWTYNPKAKLAFVPVPAVVSGEPYLIGGEDLAFGASRTGKHVDAAKKYLAFLAEPDNLATLASAAGNLAGLTNAKPDVGKLAPSFQRWVTPGKVPLKPFFDRVYLPNGMWSTVVSTADGVVAGQSSPADGAQQMASDFSTLYKKAG